MSIYHFLAIFLQHSLVLCLLHHLSQLLLRLLLHHPVLLLLLLPLLEGEVGFLSTALFEVELDLAFGLQSALSMEFFTFLQALEMLFLPPALEILGPYI